jgi:hypothetical protein
MTSINKPISLQVNEELGGWGLANYYDQGIQLLVPANLVEVSAISTRLVRILRIELGAPHHKISS